MSQVNGFTGIFDIKNWKFFDNTKDTGFCSVKFPSDALVTFSYNYNCKFLGTLKDHFFGYSYGIDGEFNQITDSNDSVEQSGTFSVKVDKGQEFCFVQKWTTENGYPGTISILEFKVVYTSTEVYVIPVDEVKDYYSSYIIDNTSYVNIYNSDSFSIVFLEYLKEEIGNYIENIEA